MKTVEIEIFGKKYFIKSNDVDDVIEKARYLNEQLESLNEKFNTVDQSKLFVLYMLILLDEFTVEKQKNEKLSAELKKLNDLLNGLNVD